MRNFFKSKLLFFCLVFITSFTHAVNATSPQEENVTESAYFVDKAVGNKHIFLEAFEVKDPTVFQLITHGKPGELLIDGQWKNVIKIASWLQKEQLSPLYEQLNIYGCNFAKGEKGQAAVEYLEATLCISVAASDDLTGIDGDWDLEVGQAKQVIPFPQYPANLQVCNCTDYLIVNDPQNNNGNGFVHKFAINSDSTLTEIFSNPPTNTDSWIPSGVIQSPHGLGVDLNGNYYIGGYVDGHTGPLVGGETFTVRKVDCDGNLFPTSEFSIETFGFNMTSYNGILYSNAGDGRITAYDPCDGSTLGYIELDGTGSGGRLDWGFEIAEDGTFYATNGFTFFGTYDNMYIYKFNPTAADFTNNTVYTPFITSASFPAMASNADIYGITTDEDGNIYTTVWELNSGSDDPVTWVLKFDSTGALVASNSEINDGVAGGTGFSMSRGIKYYEALDLLFLSGVDDCVAMVDPNTLNYVGTAVGYVPNQDGKALALARECCPASPNLTVDTTFCDAQLNDKIFLQELIDCDGTICEGVWDTLVTNVGMMYDSCDNSITITALNACGSFILESDGTGNNPQCGAFKITVNISVGSTPEAAVFVIQPSCVNGIPQADGVLQISQITSGKRFNWSVGSTYTGDPDFVDAIDTMGLSFPYKITDTLSNPTGSRDYTVRIFADTTACGGIGCGYVDYTVTLNEQDCTVGCDCNDKIYLNDPIGGNGGTNEVHKFSVFQDGSLQEIGNPWLAPTSPLGTDPLNAPHGIIADLNGSIYIGDVDAFPGSLGGIVKLNCDGEVLADRVPNIANFGFNPGMIGNKLYLPISQSGIQVWNTCDYSLEQTITRTENGWGFTISHDEQYYYYPTGWFENNNNRVIRGNIDGSGEVVFYDSNNNVGTYMGITQDDSGNLYVVESEGNNGLNNSRIIKISSSGVLVDSSAWDTDLTQINGQTSGYNFARGIIWSATSNKLYVGSGEDCIAVFDTALNYLPSLSIGYVTGSAPKGIGVLTECCPTNNNVSIDTALCAASINDVIFLQELINCDGTVCEGLWQEGMSNTGMTYNSCDNSITINSLSACGTFTLESDGTGNNPQCGAFKIEVNITVNSLDLTVTQTNCTDNGNGTFTANYDAVINWNSEPCQAGEMINVTHNGTSIGMIDPSTDSSPSTIPFTMSADGNGTNLIKAAYTIAGCSDSTSFKTPLPCPTDVTTCASTTGCIGGNAFEDFNCNGAEETNEPGVQGVQVVIYDCDNTAVDTVWTDSDGDFQLCGLTDGDAYRVEFILPESIACWAQPTHSGSDNGTDIQFLTAPACTKFSLSSPADYCQNDPSLILPCYETGSGVGNTNLVMVRVPYDASSTNTSGTAASFNEYPPTATAESMGATYGVAFDPVADLVYVSSFLKRQVGLGQRGLDGIYVLEDSGNTLAGGFDLQGVVPSNGGAALDFGSVTRNLIASGPGTGANDLSADRTEPSSDADAYGKVGKVGYGDIDFDQANEKVWVINLHERSLIAIDVSSSLHATANPSTIASTTVERWFLEGGGSPALTGMPTCTNGTMRPFALKIHKGVGYIGAVCDGASLSTIGMTAAQQAYVLSFDINNPTSLTVVTSLPLNYLREPPTANNAQNVAGHADVWQRWHDTYSEGDYGLNLANGGLLADVEFANAAPYIAAAPQPILADIEFNERGDIILGFIDRFTHQQAYNNYKPNGSMPTELRAVIGAGDILLAYNTGSSYTFEGPNELDTGPDQGWTNDGPSGAGEFFFEDHFAEGNEARHYETALGPLAVLKGTYDVVAVTMDPHGLVSQGMRWYSTANGTLSRAYEILATTGPDPSFGKGSALGDIELLCDPAPIEIGNYVWCDSIVNGIQDACERVIEDLIVQLYNAEGDLIGQDTTVNGNYYFNQYNVDTLGITVNGSGVASAAGSGDWTGMDYATQYFIVFGNGQFAGGEFTLGSETYPGVTAMANVGSNDNVDSDVDGSSLTSGSLGSRPDGLPYIDMTTAATGCGDHKFDMGILCVTPCDLQLSYTQSGCVDNADGTFTTTYDVEVSWEGAPTGDITLTHYGDGNLSTTTISAATIAGGSSTTLTGALTVPADGNGNTGLLAVFDNELTCKDSVSFKAPLPCPTDVATCASTTGCIGGNAFEDYNCNGTDDAAESGIQGVQVVIYDCDNTAVDTVWTDSDGDFQLCGLTDGENYRVEFILPESIACWASPTHSGSDNGTDVQFLTAPACTKFGISSATDYCEGDPYIIIPCFSDGAYNGGNSGEAAIVKLRESADGHDFESMSTTKTSDFEADTLATHNDVGAVYGVAWQPTKERYYLSAFHKRYVGYGPDGPDAIYQYDLAGNKTGTINLDAVLAGTNTAGSDVHDFTPAGGGDPHPGEIYDLGTGDISFDGVGKRAFGDIEMSANDSILYVVNLFDKKIYALDISSGNTATTTVVQSWDAPDATGAGRNRPFALAAHQGKLWVGSVDENGSNAYVHSLLPNTNAFNLELTIPLDYSRQAFIGDAYDVFNVGLLSDWHAWADTTNINYGLETGGGIREIGYPQPILSDIEFADNGDMILGFRDRFGDQAGAGRFFDAAESEESYAISAGDILKACLQSGSYVLESDAGSCAGTGGVSPSGPGGGKEFYSWDFYHFEDPWSPLKPNDTDLGGFHWETTQGALLQLKGRPYVITTAMDPFSDYSGGLLKFNNTTGGREGVNIDSSNYANLVGGYTLFDTGEFGSLTLGNVSFGKANGLGDLEAACAPAPLEIGNYVWCDSIQNGIQDACERGIEDMIVQLYDEEGDLVGQDTTENGNYYFNQYNVDTTGITVDGSGVATPDNGWSGMEYSKKYYIVFGNSQYNNGTGLFTVGSEAYQGITTTDAGSNDNIDSDVDGSSLSTTLGEMPANLPVICMTTDATGCGNHRYDMGVLCLPCGEIENLITQRTICSGELVDSLVVTTTFENPDSIAFVYFATAQTDSIMIYTGGTGIDTVQIASANDTVGIYAISGFTNAGITADTFYVYAIAHPTPTGADCRPYQEIKVIVNACDWGDLPDVSAGTAGGDYQTSDANSGPVHVIIPGLTLGTTVDGEPDGQPSMDAMDDGVDEDGLTIFSTLDISPGSTFRLPLNYTNTTGMDAEIEAWIDWNYNGEFDAGEMVFDATNPSASFIEITVPNDAVTGEFLGVRIRISKEDNMTPYGRIASGEVEDYLIGLDCKIQICVPTQNTIIRK